MTTQPIHPDSPNHSAGKTQFIDIPIHEIAPDAQQPRKQFDDDRIAELALSIRNHGLLSPIIVRDMPTNAIRYDNLELNLAKYMIIAGERRWRACMLNGADTVPAIVRNGLSDDQVRSMQIIENIDRADLTLTELIAGCAALVAQMGLTKAAEQLGKSKSWVSDRASLLEIPSNIKSLVDNGTLADVEISHSLVKISALDPALADRLIVDFENGQPHTRASVREIYSQCKDAHRRQIDAAKAQDNLGQRPINEGHQSRHQSRDSTIIGHDSARSAVFTKPESGQSAVEQELQLRNERRSTLKKELEDAHPEIAKAISESLRDSDGLFIGMNPSMDFYNKEPPATLSMLVVDLYIEGNAQQVAELLNGFDGSLKMSVSADMLFRDIEDIPAKISPAQSIAVNDPTDPHLIRKFVAEIIEQSPGSRLTGMDLYKAYAHYCSAMRSPPIAVNDDAWGLTLESCGLKKIRSNGVKYLDIKLAQ